jgi:hypothetical protein
MQKVMAGEACHGTDECLVPDVDLYFFPFFVCHNQKIRAE